ncbi:MAG: hypothetical protein WKF97_16310 [Chitinophagaceae bacterium]
MAAASLDNEFMKYWLRLTPLQKESLLSVVKNFVNLEEEVTSITIEQYNQEIAEAMQRMDTGESYTHEQVVELSKSWLNGK